MATTKTLNGPVVPIGDSWRGFGMDAVSSLCNTSDGTYVGDTASNRADAKRAGISVKTSDVQGRLQVVGAKWADGARVREAQHAALKGGA